MSSGLKRSLQLGIDQKKRKKKEQRGGEKSLRLPRRHDFYLIVADAFSSFSEAVDDLFLHTLAYECMGNDFYTNAITYTWHLPILLPKKRISLN